HVMAEVLYENLSAVGAPQYGPEAVAVAQEIQKNLGLTPSEKPFLAATEQLIEPVEAERKLRDSMPAWQENWTSDDYVEMSHYAPLVGFSVARLALGRMAGAGPDPGWEMNALGGTPEHIAPTIRVTGKPADGTFVDLFADPRRLAEA